MAVRLPKPQTATWITPALEVLQPPNQLAEGLLQVYTGKTSKQRKADAELERDLEVFERAKEAAIGYQEFEAAAKIRELVDRIKKERKQ